MVMTARVRGVTAASTAAADSHGSVSPATSAKTGVAPVYATALTVATKLSEGTITSSPGPSPAARQIRCNAAVQLVTASACSAPTYSENRDSSSSVRGPMLSQPERYTSATALISGSPISTWASGTRHSGIFEQLGVRLDLDGGTLVLADRPDVEPDSGPR